MSERMRAEKVGKRALFSLFVWSLLTLVYFFISAFSSWMHMSIAVIDVVQIAALLISLMPAAAGIFLSCHAIGINSESKPIRCLFGLAMTVLLALINFWSFAFRPID